MPLILWELIETKLRALPSLREENRRLQRLLIGNAVDLELDGSGRFLVPPRLREYAKLDKRAMLVGQLNKFQLWDEDAWDAVSAADLAAIQQPGAMPDELPLAAEDGRFVVVQRSFAELGAEVAERGM
eukprot:gene16983-16802_t